MSILPRIAAIGAVLLVSVVATPSQSTAAGTAPSVQVSGNRLVDQNGATVVLRGVNRSGAEFACVQGWGFWDGPADQASIDAMKTWKINAVRVPLNEACWNSLSYVNTTYAGANYQNAIKNYVNLLNANGLIAILDLHWTDGLYTGSGAGCSDAKATCQKPMPDAAQAIPFWTSVANTFKGNNSVIFDLFNEPFPEQATGNATTAWQCLRDGGTCSGIGYQVAGMQSLVNAVRSTGAHNVVMTAGLSWSNDMSQWLTYKPTDPDNNLVAAHHSYGSNTCNNTTCWDQKLAPIIAQGPLVVGEIGQDDCAHSYIDSLMGWLDSHGAGYTAWTWNTWDCKTGPSLISNYDGTPTAYGVGLKNHLATLTTADTQAPSAPTGLNVTSTTSSSVTLAWTASTDNVGVTGYRVLRGGIQVGTSSGTSYTDSGLSPSTAYSYTVKAVDAAGNVSAASAALPATTSAAPPPPSTYRFDFEDGTTQGWKRSSGKVWVENSAVRASTGSRSLAAHLTGGGTPNIATTTGLAGLASGTVVTARVWAPAGSALRVQGYSATKRSQSNGPVVTLTANAWTTISFTVPTVPSSIGLQFPNPNGWQGVYYVDAITW